MKKRMMALLCSSLMMATANAQSKSAAWINNVKLSGYAMVRYQYAGKHDDATNGFDLRLGRVILDGRAGRDWYWKFQFQVQGNVSTLTSSPRMVDAYTEWQKYDFLKVRVGQFKRPFTFESPLHPITQGFMGFATVINKLSYYSDRAGAMPSNGRDIGIQLQGDVLRNKAGRHLLHYQVGVFNGQGINTKDVDQQKDIIGGFWVMPVPGLRIGAFGSEGSFARKGVWTDAQGVKHDGICKLPQHRYALSAEYKFDDWTIRSEYIHSTGKAFAKAYKSADDAKNCTVNETIGDKADGMYALVLAPVMKKRLYAKARYNLYRNTAHWSDSETMYEVGVNYMFNKNVQLNTEYIFVNNRALAHHHNYNMLDIELDFKF